MIILDNSQTWSLEHGHFLGLQAIEAALQRGCRISAGDLVCLLGFSDDRQSPIQRQGSVAVIQLRGLLVPDFSFLGRRIQGGTSRFRSALRAAIADPDISKLLLDVDSPGGSTVGVEESFEELFAARRKKRIIASVNSLGASAAYWIASAAHEIAVTPSGHVGSIGVLGVHMDRSEAAKKQGVSVSVVSAGKYKHEASEFSPMTEGARQHLQSLVDERYAVFVRAVSRGRRVSQKKVKNGYAEGRLVPAKDALSMGMVDSIETFDQVLERATGQRRKVPPLTKRAQMQLQRLEVTAPFVHLESVGELQEKRLEELQEYDPKVALQELEKLEASL